MAAGVHGVAARRRNFVQVTRRDNPPNEIPFYFQALAPSGGIGLFFATNRGFEALLLEHHFVDPEKPPNLTSRPRQVIRWFFFVLMQGCNRAGAPVNPLVESDALV